jgi:hypothetical protein
MAAAAPDFSDAIKKGLGSATTVDRALLATLIIFPVQRPETGEQPG